MVDVCLTTEYMAGAGVRQLRVLEGASPAVGHAGSAARRPESDSRFRGNSGPWGGQSWVWVTTRKLETLLL